MERVESHARARRLVGAGPVLHDLFILAANAGDWPEADRLARRALRAYGKRHPRLPALAYDVAYSWMLRGFFDQALPVFQAVVQRTTDRPLRLLFVSSLARAASAAGKKLLFAEAWIEAWAIIHGQESTERVPEALINLARGAATLHDGEHAHIAAHYALSVALLRREAHARMEAESILDSITRAELANVAAEVPIEPAAGEEQEPLAQRFLRALAAPAM